MFDYATEGIHEELCKNGYEVICDADYSFLLPRHTVNLLDILKQVCSQADFSEHCDRIITLLFENLSEPVCLTDDKLEVILMNDAWRSLGKVNHLKDLRACLSKRNFAILQEAVSHQKGIDRRMILSQKTGGKESVLILLPFQGPGRLPGYLLLASDGHMLRQNAQAVQLSPQYEKPRRESHDRLPIGFLDLLDGFCLVVDNQLTIEQVFGSVPPGLAFSGKDLPGRSLDGLLHKESRKIVKKAVDELLQGSVPGQRPIKIETDLAGKGKRYYPFQLILGKNSGSDSCLVMFRDILEFRMREEKLTREKNQAELNDRMKSNYLANMSHEIRTPLNGIVGFSSMLNADGLTPEKREKYIRIIRSSSLHLLALISDIIDLSRIEAGQMKLMDQEVDIHQLFDYLVATFISEAKRLEKKDVRIVKQVCRSRSGLKIWGDEVRIKQVLSNFMGNALKFTSMGEIRLGYSLEVQGHIKFYVCDSGTGINKEDLQSVFDRFKQTREGRKEKYEGTGLGLAISRSIVELMGGSIGARSEPGKGSEFYFTIPFRECLRGS